MTKKEFRIKGENIKQLIKTIGGCYATDKITVDGELIGFMYREQPEFKDDSGWRFLSGSESQEYADNANNWTIYDTNTIVNYDKSIIPYLEFPIGTELERIKNSDKFK